jgi:hypothetical protein
MEESGRATRICRMHEPKQFFFFALSLRSLRLRVLLVFWLREVKLRQAICGSLE